MSTTLEPTVDHLDLTPLSEEHRPVRGGRAKWPLFGVVAGVTGYVSAVAALSNGVTEEDARAGADVIGQLERAPYHVAFLTGLVSVAALFVVAAGWRRWAERNAPDDLAARIVGTAIGATAAINVIFTCLAGSMALYLPGGTDHGWLSNDGMFVNYTLLDFGSLLGWWGTFVAAGCVATLALRRRRVLPRWMGVLSVVLMAPPLLFGAVTALPGFVGLTMPIWIVVTSIGLVFSRTARA